MAGELTDMLDSENDKVAELLKEAFKAHVVELSSVKCKVGELEKKCKKLEQRNIHLLHKGRDLQGKFDRLSSEYENIKIELDERKTRLSMPCKGCQMLKGQLGQQEKLYNMMLCNMYPDKSCQDKSLKVLEAGKNTVHQDSLKQYSADQVKTVSAEKKNLLSDSQLEQNSHKVSNTSVVEVKTKSLRLHKRTRTKYSEDFDHGVKKAKLSSPESSCHKELLALQANETQHEARGANINILELETCDPDFGQEAAAVNSNSGDPDKYRTSRSAQQGQDSSVIQHKHASAKPNITIPETVPFYNSFCEDENDEVTAKGSNECLEDKSGKHQTVICLLSPPSHASTPMPSGGSCQPHFKSADLMVTPKKKHLADHHDSSEPSSPVFGDNRKLVIKQEMIKKLIHSPSLFDEDPSVIPVKDKLEADFPHQTRLDNNEAFRNNNAAAMDIDLSVSQNDSVSVLPGMSGDGKSTAAISTTKSCNAEDGNNHLEAKIWKKPQVIKSNIQCDQWVDSKRMMQTTLKLTKYDQMKDQSMSDDSFDLDETRDLKSAPQLISNIGLSRWSGNNVLREFESKEVILPKAVENSRQQFEKKEKSTGTISSEQFTEPQFTSTQKCDVSVQSECRNSFKCHKTSLSVKDKHHKYGDSDHELIDEGKDSAVADQDMASLYTLDADVNGTVDPNIHLSQYDSPPDKYQEQKSRVASDNTQTKSRHHATSSKNPDEVSNVSGKSVLFGGRPKQTAKNAKSRRYSVKDEKFEVKHMDQDSFLEIFEENGEPISMKEDSFDRLPEKETGPGYAYVDVVRKKSERQKLKSYVCPQCIEYYDGLELSEEEKKKRMKYCRHKARYSRPETPEHYWSISFPDTQEAEERGYLKTTQVKPSGFRRKQGLRPLFLEGEKKQS